MRSTKPAFLLMVLVAITGCGGGTGGAPEKRLKAFAAGIAAENHTGAPFYTSLSDFEDGQDLRDLYLSAAERRGWDIVTGKFLGAAPANKVLRPAYETMRAELLADLEAAMPVDMVVLGLHGAMVAQGYDDVEGDLMQEIRKIVGPDVPIGAGMDPHAHLSQAMLDAADIMVFYKEWPHIDAEETYVKSFDLTADVVEGKIAKPHMAMWDARMIDDYHTLKEPLKSLVDDMKAAEGKDSVVSVNFIHGFPNADVPAMGSKILVITDDRPEEGAALAEEFGRRLFAMRGKTAVPPLDLEAGLEAAVASTNHPVVIADYSDMPFGGAPGDSTFILEGLIDRGVENAIIAGLWDPIAVSTVADLAKGDTLNMRIGGKAGPMSGDPLDLEVEVRYVVKDMWLTDGHSMVGAEGQGTPVGTIAVVRAHGIDIVLVEKRYPIYGYKVLEALEMEPRDSRVIVVKSANNFYDGYVEIAGDVLYVMSPGLIGYTRDLRLTRIDRPKWPFDEDPFQEAEAGR